MVYQVKGKGTLALSKKKAGERVDVLGPLGNSFRFDNNIVYGNKEQTGKTAEIKRAAIIGGGIRITSYNVCYTKLLRVSASDNMEVIGAAVQVEGTTLGTITGIDGSFVLPNAPINGTLVVTYIGYKVYKTAIQKNKIYEIKLIEDTKVLDVITSYSIHYTKLYEAQTISR